MPKQPKNAKWKKAAARYDAIAKKLKPFVRSAKKGETRAEGVWRKSGELQDENVVGFQSGS